MLDNIHDNIAKLISMYEAERQRAEALEHRKADMEAEILEYRKQITELNRQIDNLRLAGAVQTTADRREARASVDSLIRKIDRCIKLLES